MSNSWFRQVPTPKPLIKIIEFSNNLNLNLDAIADIDVPNISQLKTKVEISFTPKKLSFHIPMTPIPGGTLLKKISSGLAGQLVSDDYFGKIEGTLSDGRIFKLSKALRGGRTKNELNHHSWKGTAHSLLITSKNMSQQYIDSYIVQDIVLPHWPDITDIDEFPERSSATADALELDLSGTKIRIQNIGDDKVKIIFHEPSTKKYAHGKFLEVFRKFFGFFCGANNYLIKKELFDTNGDIVEESFLRSGYFGGYVQYRPPLPLDVVTYQAWQFNSRIEKMWPNFLKRKDKIFLIDAINHLHNANNATIEGKYSNLSIALETLSSSYSRFKNGDQMKSSKYAEKKVFRKNIKPVRKLFKERFGKIISERDIDSMVGKLDGINNRAMQDNFSSLARDLGLILTKHEKFLLKKRNVAIHDGVLSRDRKNIDYQVIDDMEYAFQALIHKIILRIYDYDDLFIDYGTHGHPSESLSKFIMSQPPIFPQRLQQVKADLFDKVSSEIFRITGGRVRL